jgi:hypothetical protein
MGDPLSVMSQGIEILDKVGILETVRNKLVNNPDAAAKKLARVLVALKRTYQIMDDALVDFNSLSFEDEFARHDALEILNRARGGRLENEMMEARGHCSNITRIYHNYLTGWFSKVLNHQEQAQIDDLFKSLSFADDTWITMLGTVGSELQRISDDILSHVNAKKYDDARATQQGELKNFQKHQTRLSKGLVDLQKLTQDYSAIAGEMGY